MLPKKPPQGIRGNRSKQRSTEQVPSDDDEENASKRVPYSKQLESSRFLENLEQPELRKFTKGEQNLKDH